MSVGILERCARHGDRIAIRDHDGWHSYAELLAAADAVAGRLLAGRPGLNGERVAYLLPPASGHVAAQWGIWSAGGVGVPLAISHPAPELGKLLEDARPAYLLVDDAHLERGGEAVRAAVAQAEATGAEARPQIEIIVIDATCQGATREPVRESAADRQGGEAPERKRRSHDLATHEGHPPGMEPGRDALIVYTSGTTGRPKGVVSTHANLTAQIGVLAEAWGWNEADAILHVLPLHHVHGIVNALCCALWSGATCRFGPPDAARIWDELKSGEVTVFMAVPTIYRRLVAAWDAADVATRRRWAQGAAAARLMVSGSAPLPVDLFARWQEITGHALLERYGMTEIGMALSNPLRGERRPGTVGQPLVGVQARLVDEDGDPVEEGEQGEVQVKGPQVFREYWRRPQETVAAFTDDGWFRTGDEAVVESGYWRIVGRRSVDIIKTGGYKVSALEIEAVLREHPGVEDATVVGIDDEEWGQRICAAVVRAPGAAVAEDALREWCKLRLAPYKVPKQLVTVASLPRNAMGKVTKRALHPIFFRP